MLEIALTIAGQILLDFVLLYLIMGLISASISFVCIILMQIPSPEAFKQWEAQKPIKNLHYIPQVIICGLFFWPLILHYSFKKEEK